MNEEKNTQMHILKNLKPVWAVKVIERHHGNLRNIAMNVRQGAAEQDKEIKRLRTAIQKTLNENGHLADGENCTLIHLVRAMEPLPSAELRNRNKHETE